MESTINAVFTVLGIVLAGSAMRPIYGAVKNATLLKVHQGIPSLENFTRKLTRGSRAKSSSRKSTPSPMP